MDPDIRSAYFSREIPEITDQNLFFLAFLKKSTRCFLKNLFIFKGDI